MLENLAHNHAGTTVKQLCSIDGDLVSVHVCCTQNPGRRPIYFATLAKNLYISVSGTKSRCVTHLRDEAFIVVPSDKSNILSNSTVTTTINWRTCPTNTCGLGKRQSTFQEGIELDQSSTSRRKKTGVSSPVKKIYLHLLSTGAGRFLTSIYKLYSINCFWFSKLYCEFINKTLCWELVLTEIKLNIIVITLTQLVKVNILHQGKIKHYQLGHFSQLGDEEAAAKSVLSTTIELTDSDWRFCDLETFGLSALWSLMWYNKPSECWNVLPHVLHKYGFSSVWTFMCLVNLEG